MTPPRQAKLRGILAERGISQKAVAKAIGMNENYFSDRMTGDVDFRWSEVVKICRLLEIDDPLKVFEPKETTI